MTRRRTRRLGWLWRMLPSDLREVYGDEMADVLEERLTEERTRAGRVAVARYRFRFGVDPIGVVVRAWGGGAKRLALRPSGPRQRSRRSILDSFPQNLRFAIRALLRRPAFTAAAVLTLALGIGANAAMFGVIKTVVLAPLPFEAPDRVVQFWDVRRNRDEGVGSPMSLANFRDYETRNEVFSHVASVRPVSLWAGREDRLESMPGYHLSADLFEMMSVVPTRGRRFREDEDVEGVGTIVLLTHACWLREFGGEEVVGQTIPLRHPQREWQSEEYEIIGVLPPDFRVPPLRGTTSYGRVGPEPEVVLPMGLWTWGGDSRGMYSIRALAQLRAGVTVEQARASLQGIAAGIAERRPRIDPTNTTVPDALSSTDKAQKLRRLSFSDADPCPL